MCATFAEQQVLDPGVRDRLTEQRLVEFMDGVQHLLRARDLEAIRILDRLNDITVRMRADQGEEKLGRFFTLDPTGFAEYFDAI
jgi:hypothetical protein